MERGVASRGARLVTARLGRPRDPARRALGPGCGALAVTDPDAGPVREARHPRPGMTRRKHAAGTKRCCLEEAALKPSLRFATLRGARVAAGVGTCARR